MPKSSGVSNFNVAKKIFLICILQALKKAQPPVKKNIAVPKNKKGAMTQILFPSGVTIKQPNAKIDGISTKKTMQTGKGFNQNQILTQPTELLEPRPAAKVRPVTLSKSAATIDPPTSSQNKSQQKPLKGVNITVCVQTAEAIARNATHKSQKEVLHLLSTWEKGWIDDQKFCEILTELAFR